MTRARVYEVAKQCNVDSRVALSALREMGEFVRSPSSVLPPGVAAALRERIKSLPPELKQAAPLARPPRSALKPRPYRPRREWYRGDMPGEFTRLILDEHLVPRRDPRGLPPRTDYWQDEVSEAERLAAAWSRCLLESMSQADIIAWIETGVGVDSAIDLHRRGVKPKELGWNYEDRDQGTLACRLALGLLRVEEVALEVAARRQAEC